MKLLFLASLMFGLTFAGQPVFDASHQSGVVVQQPLVWAMMKSQMRRDVPLQSSTPLTSTPTVSPSVYLPAMFGRPGILSGYVYSGSVPVAGYPVYLVWMFTVQLHPEPMPYKTTYTDANGRYEFMGASPRHPSIFYRAEIYPSERGGDILIVATNWFTYTDGKEDKLLPPLDAGATLRLVDPNDGATITPPYTFRWTSNMTDVTEYRVVFYTAPCCAGLLAGQALTATLPAYNPNIDPWNRMSRAGTGFYLMAFSDTWYVRSKDMSVKFNTGP